MKIMFCSADILNIGYHAFNENGKLHILTNHRNAGLEVKVLSEILKCFGNYTVVDVDEYYGDMDASFCDENGEVEYFLVDEIMTDLPWEDYVEVESYYNY